MRQRKGVKRIVPRISLSPMHVRECDEEMQREATDAVLTAISANIVNELEAAAVRVPPHISIDQLVSHGIETASF